MDLGLQPDPDMLLDPGDPDAPVARVDAWICGSCGLVQLAGPRPDGPLPPHGHGAASHPDADPWVAGLLGRIPSADRLVVNAEDAGSLVASGRTAGLIVASHTLSHVDDLDGLLDTIELALARDGVLAIEFHHVLGLARGQFDVLSHAHRSYLSLHALEALLGRHGLVALSAESVDTFGGTLRVVAKREHASRPAREAGSSLGHIRDAERDGQLAVPAGFAGLPARVARASVDLRDFLDRSAKDGVTVAGYGAAARGTALLNIAGIGLDRLPFTVDRSLAKQGRLLPGSRIPVFPPSEIQGRRPGVILVLPWPLVSEIVEQLAGERARGARFAVAMPQLEVLP